MGKGVIQVHKNNAKKFGKERATRSDPVLLPVHRKDLSLGGGADDEPAAAVTVFPQGFRLPTNRGPVKNEESGWSLEVSHMRTGRTSGRMDSAPRAPDSRQCTDGCGKPTGRNVTHRVCVVGYAMKAKRHSRYGHTAQSKRNHVFRSFARAWAWCHGSSGTISGPRRHRLLKESRPAPSVQRCAAQQWPPNTLGECLWFSMTAAVEYCHMCHHCWRCV